MAGNTEISSADKRLSLPSLSSDQSARSLHLLLTLIGSIAIVMVIGLTRWLAVDLGDTITRNTVRLSLSWYLAALLLMLGSRPSDWSALTKRGLIMRWCWTWAMLSFLVHLAMAFHYYHHWSHADAFERTRQVSGTGEGIYVSYLFTWLWLGDVLWWWLNPSSYSRRAVAIGRTLHTFMLFIVFNGTVVYETGVIRWAGLIGFGLLAGRWLITRMKA